MLDAPTISAKPLKKRLAVFLDGTWNAVDDNTNVWRLKSLCSEESDDGSLQAVYYDIGVNGFLGGMLGKGLSANVTEAYQWLIEQYHPGDEIFIFGFSRGAFTARSLAGFITKYGLLNRRAPLGVKQLYDRYRRSVDRTIWKLLEIQADGTLRESSLEEQWMIKYSQAVNIKAVAVWDTVPGTLGIPIFNIRGISRSTLGFFHTGLRQAIENGYHAIAIDDHRRAFFPILWTVRKPKEPDAKIVPPRSLASVEQRWFVGAHANVGGGYPSDLLAQLPLRWMMKKASIHGLTFQNDIEIDGITDKATIPDSYREFMYGVYSGFSWPYYRPIGEAPKQKNDGTHSNVNETIDASVFDRWRNVSEYRPPGLVDWARRYKAKPEEINTSVRANAPQIAAPD